MLDKKIPRPKPKLSAVRGIIVTLLFTLSAFTLGYGMGIKGFYASFTNFPRVVVNRETPPERDADFSQFWQIWNTLDTSYYDKTKLVPSAMVQGAIKGMVAAIGDPYTVYLSADENRVTEEDLKGNFEGVGIQIGYIGSQLAVMAPLPGTPAFEAGIQPGDFIIGIKDEAKDIERGTAGMTLPEAIQIIRGPANTKVTMSLLREGSEDPIIVDVVRRSIDVPSVLLAYTGEGEHVAHLSVLRFGAETKGEWDEKVNELLVKPELAGIIIDLRNNPGGYLQGAIDLGTEFLNMNDVVVQEESGDGTKQPYRTQANGRLKNQKVVVLVNKGSASASEIFAGALRDNNDTTIIGTTSFGKGTIQEPLQLDSGAGLHITIAKWLTPNGTWINGEGISPDIEIKDDPNTPEDEQLAAAVKYINGEKLTSR